MNFFKNKNIIGFYLLIIGLIIFTQFVLKLTTLIPILVIGFIIGLHLFIFSIISKTQKSRYYVMGSTLLSFVTFLFIILIFDYFSEYKLLKLLPFFTLIFSLFLILYKVIINPKSISIYIAGFFLFFFSIFLLLHIFKILTDFKKAIILIIPVSLIYLGSFLLTNNNKSNE